MSTPLPIRAFGGFLFDMDGTILSSIASAERAWTVWAKRQGLDVEAFLPTIHGVQSVETIRRLNLPGIDPVAEAHALTEAEMLDVDDVVPIGGAAAFLAALPPDRWAIVTSAPKRLAEVRLKAAGLPLPGVFVTASCWARNGWVSRQRNAWPSRTRPPGSLRPKRRG
jgi:sugar-phosphatase